MTEKKQKSLWHRSIGRGLANGITAALVWMTENLGVFGYAVFSGVQQLIVITGLHHVFGAIESQLLVDTGRNFLNPLMSVAIIAQGGAVLGYLARNRRDAKARELCIPSFISVLFGITEPALFGVNLRYRYPIDHFSQSLPSPRIRPALSTPEPYSFPPRQA